MKKMNISGQAVMVVMMTQGSTPEDWSLSITRKKRSLEDFNQWVITFSVAPDSIFVMYSKLFKINQFTACGSGQKLIIPKIPKDHSRTPDDSKVDPNTSKVCRIFPKITWGPLKSSRDRKVSKYFPIHDCRLPKITQCLYHTNFALYINK